MRALLGCVVLLCACDPVGDPIQDLPLGDDSVAWVAPAIPTPERVAAPNPLGDAEDWPEGRYAVSYDNGLDESIIAVLRLPAGVDRVPVVMVLHGSGGLFRTPDDPSAFDPQSGTLGPQFRDWDAMIEAEGYATFLPASFYSRGSFDWNDDPLPDVTVEERLRLRTHDVLGAQRWLCGHPRIDCGRTAIVGFSNGGSALVLSQYADLNELPGFDRALVPPPARRAASVTAFYPGCGLYGIVPMGDGDYRPRVPLLMFHGSKDSLVADCRDRVQQNLEHGGGVEHVVFTDVGHGFDSDPHGIAEDLAQVEARAMTFARIHEAFTR